MACTYSLPDSKAIAGLLTMLLGKDVSVKKCASGLDASDTTAVTGVYVDQQQSAGAICILDLTLASYAGAALTMIHAGVANECIRDGKLMENLAENLHEIFNVCVAFFNQGDVPHIRFSDMHTEPVALADEGERFANSGAVSRLDVEVDIAGYGSGRMSLLTA